jgi:hypothetical protein
MFFTNYSSGFPGVGAICISRSLSSENRFLKQKDGWSCQDPGQFLPAVRLDTATGYYRSAIASLLKFQHFHDSLFDETSSRQMQREVEYETQKNKN